MRRRNKEGQEDFLGSVTSLLDLIKVQEHLCNNNFVSITNNSQELRTFRKIIN